MKKQRDSVSIQEKNNSIECGHIKWWDIDPAEISDTRSNGIKQWVGELRSGEQAPQKGKDNGGGKTEHEGWERGQTQPRLGRVVDGVDHRVDRLKAIGNGQVPAVAALAFTVLSEGLI